MPVISPLPTPTITTTRDRLVRADYLLWTDEDGTKHFATVSAYHSGNPRYAISVSVNKESEEPRSSGFTARGYFPFDAKTVHVERGVKRYSEAKVRAALDAVLAQLPTLIAEHAEIAAFFEVED